MKVNSLSKSITCLLILCIIVLNDPVLSQGLIENPELDKKVEAFLESYGGLPSVIVLTTSNGGDILPEMKDRRIDAISSASTKDRIDPVAHEIIHKINLLLESS